MTFKNLETYPSQHSLLIIEEDMISYIHVRDGSEQGNFDSDSIQFDSIRSFSVLLQFTWGESNRIKSFLGRFSFHLCCMSGFFMSNSHETQNIFLFSIQSKAIFRKRYQRKHKMCIQLLFFYTLLIWRIILFIEVDMRLINMLAVDCLADESSLCSLNLHKNNSIKEVW
jgi:hypothetical protein